MIHLLQLEKLLNEVIEKSEIYFSIGDSDTNGPVPFSGTYAEKLRNAREDWKAAEKAYKSFLHTHKMQPIVSEDCFSAHRQLS